MAILEGIKTTLNDRLKSPFWGIYIFAWVTFNWRVVLYLFSGLTIGAKINAIEGQFPSPWDHLMSFIAPFGITIFTYFLSATVNSAFAQFAHKLESIDLHLQVANADRKRTLERSVRDIRDDARHHELDLRSNDLDMRERVIQEQVLNFRVKTLQIGTVDKEWKARAESVRSSLMKVEIHLDGCDRIAERISRDDSPQTIVLVKNDLYQKVSTATTEISELLALIQKPLIDRTIMEEHLANL